MVAVSRCLLGEEVRYDGGSYRVPWIVEVLSEHCDIFGLCPEVAAGLGVPRPPMRLCMLDGSLSLLGRDDPTLEVTADLLSASYGILDDLSVIDGFILKSRSPSCGVADTPMFDCSDPPTEIGTGSGLFTQLVRKKLPSVPVVDENGLLDEAGRVSFLVSVFRHCCRRHVRQPA